MTRLLTYALAVIGFGVILGQPGTRKALSALTGSLSGARPALVAVPAKAPEGPGAPGVVEKAEAAGPDLPQPASDPAAGQDPAAGDSAEPGASSDRDALQEPAAPSEEASSAGESPLLKALEVYERAELAAKSKGDGS